MAMANEFIFLKSFFGGVFVVKRLPEDIVDSDSFKCKLWLNKNQHMKICVHKTNKLKGDDMNHNYMEICLNVEAY